jgi:homogentisate 1,2-dioxygenase
MSSSVLHMDGSETLEEIYNILQGATYKYIHFNIIDKSDTDKNIIELSFDDNELKQKLIVLANYGFMVYVHRGSVSSLVHYSEIKNLWIPVKEGDYSINPDGVVYSFEKAQCSDDEKLLFFLKCP